MFDFLKEYFIIWLALINHQHNNSMPKLLAILIFVLRITCKLNAQQDSIQLNTTDSIPKRDSSIIEDLKDNVIDNIPIITLDDNDLSDASAQNISSLLTAGRDPFYNAATFNFSAARFRIRGYDADYTSTYINGIPMDNLDNGYTPFGLWGGLNDVFRNRDINIGIRYNTFAFGDIGNTTNIDVRASKQKPQTNIGYAYSNRSYDHRIIFTHSTGINKKGWAFTIVRQPALCR